MKKILLAFICFIGFSLYADDLSPSNYTQQVVHDIDSIITVCDGLWDSYAQAMFLIDDVLNYSYGLSGSDRTNLTSAKASLAQTRATNKAITNYLYGIKSAAQNLIYTQSYSGSVTDFGVVTNIYSYLDSWQRNELVLIYNVLNTTLTNISAITTELLSDPYTGKLSLDDHLNEQRDFLLSYTADLDVIKTHLNNISRYLNSIQSLVYSIAENVTYMRYYLADITGYLQYFKDDLSPLFIRLASNFTNVFWLVGRDDSVPTPTQYRYFVATKSNPSAIPSFTFSNVGINRAQTYRLETIGYWLVDQYARAIASLNNYAYTNMVSLGSIAFNTSKTNDFSTIVSAIDRGSESITNTINSRFTIFDVSSPLQSYYNLNNNPTNAYYNFLTNYYLNVSLRNASGSASESHTNWFSRIEMLLGALVFKDASDGSFSPGEINMDSVENAYDSFTQSLESAVEIPSSFQTKIENAEQSILDYMQEWHTIISSATLGSHFTLCDVQLTDDDGSSSRRDGSIPSFDGRMTLTIPIDGDFKRFLDVARALSTVCFITLFLVMSLKLIIFLLRACASITRVCYALFMAIAGH